MPKFTKPEPQGPNSVAALTVPAPIAERGMVVIKLAVPPWEEAIISVFRNGLQEWLNKAHRGELNPGDQFVIVVP
jgi:hypothetical protein